MIKFYGRIKIGRIYQHYKENKYALIGLVKHSGIMEELIVYKALYRDVGLWERPKQMFF